MTMPFQNWVQNLHFCSPQPDYDQITSVSFLVDPDNPSQRPIQVKKGTWVTAKVETFGKDGEAFKAKEVALVLAVLQVSLQSWSRAKLQHRTLYVHLSSLWRKQAA